MPSFLIEETLVIATICRTRAFIREKKLFRLKWKQKIIFHKVNFIFTLVFSASNITKNCDRL